MSSIFPVCVSSELDLFKRPPIQTSVISSKWVEYKNKTDYMKGASPIQIDVPAVEGEYIDMSNVFIQASMSIVLKSNQMRITEADEIAPINYLLNTVFKTVDIYLNNTKVSMSEEYPYKSVIQAILNYGTEAKNTHLDASLWYKDSGQMDSQEFSVKKENGAQTSGDKKDPPKLTKRSVPESTTNQGLISRRDQFLGKSCEMFGRLHADIFNIDRFLIDGVNLSLIFTKKDDKFCLIGKKHAEYSINIDDISLYVRRCVISPDILVAHSLALERANAFYPISRVDVKASIITQGVDSHIFENLVTGPLPKRIILGMVASRAFNGVEGTNPFNFQHFNLSDLSVTLNGLNIPYPDFKFDYRDDSISPKYLRSYYNLFTSNDFAYRNGNDLTPVDFKNGYHLLSLDLSQDGCLNSDHYNPDKSGNLRLVFKFASPTPNPIYVIQYLEYESFFEITKLRQVEYKYTV
jgi:hypothetical protein